MAPSYHQVRERIQLLEREAKLLRQVELRKVLAELRQKIAEYGITQEELFGNDLSKSIRFRDPATGRTWTGLGRPPNWIRGKDREPFRVE